MLLLVNPTGELIPDWFVSKELSGISYIVYISYSFAVFFLFFKYEKKIKIEISDRHIIFSRIWISIAISLFFYIFFKDTVLNIDIRDFAQENSLNTAYNIAKVLIVLYYFNVFKAGLIFNSIALLFVGYFNVFSGSKASLFLPILILLTITKQFTFKSSLILIVLFILACLEIIPTHYIVRYLDIGLSSYQAAYIYQSTEVPLLNYYIEWFSSKLSGGELYNPVIEYLNDTNIAKGYNLTPTVVGELMGSGYIVGILLFSYIVCSLKLMYRIAGVAYKPVFCSWFFVFISTMQSSLMDQLFYNAYFAIALVLAYCTNLINVRLNKKF